MALLLPGFGGAASQPMLVRLEERLTALGVRCHRVAPPKARPTPELAAELGWLAGEVEATGATILVGRSFGGRLCARWAAAHGARCVVLLGFPVRPPKRPRPLDEAALAALECPTLIVQGSMDELGPLRVLRPLGARNRRLELHVLEGAGHSFGKQERAALDFAAAWVGAHLA